MNVSGQYNLQELFKEFVYFTENNDFELCQFHSVYSRAKKIQTPCFEARGSFSCVFVFL